MIEEEHFLWRLSRIDNLETEIVRLQGQLNELTDQCNQTQQTLTRLQGETSKARDDLTQVNQTKSQVELEGFTLLDKSKQEEDRIKFAENLCKLFEDVSQVPFATIYDFSLKLLMIWETGLKHVGYAIDYSEARQTALSLLEQVLGKSLVRRDVFDSAVKKHDDLMLDRLDNMELERAKIKKESDELAKSKESFETLTLDQAVGYFSRPEVGHLIGNYRCRVCKRTMAFTIVGQPDHLTSCLFCGGRNPSSKESPVNSTNTNPSTNRAQSHP